MTTSEKPTLHLEGRILAVKEVEENQPYKVRIGELWLATWDESLIPLLTKGRYVAVDYTSTQKGRYTNNTIQAAVEMMAPKPGAETTSVPPPPGNGYRDSRESSIEAQVAAYCTAQVLAATIQYGEGGFEIHEIPELIGEFYQGMQEAKAGKHTGGAALSTGEQTKLLSPDSPAKPTTRPSVHPDSEAGPGAALPIKPDISIGAFWKGWKEAKLPTTNKGVEELISQATGGKALQVQQAQDIGWRLDELLAKVLEVKEKP